MVAVLVGTPFGGGVHVSLYRGSGNINNLDLRTDFVRTWQGERLNLLNGSWSSQPWYALRGNSRRRVLPRCLRCSCDGKAPKTVGLSGLWRIDEG